MINTDQTSGSNAIELTNKTSNNRSRSQSLEREGKKHTQAGQATKFQGSRLVGWSGRCVGLSLAWLVFSWRSVTLQPRKLQTASPLIAAKWCHMWLSGPDGSICRCNRYLCTLPNTGQVAGGYSVYTSYNTRHYYAVIRTVDGMTPLTEIPIKTFVKHHVNVAIFSCFFSSHLLLIGDIKCSSKFAAE